MVSAADLGDCQGRFCRHIFPEYPRVNQLIFVNLCPCYFPLSRSIFELLPAQMGARKKMRQTQTHPFGIYLVFLILPVYFIVKNNYHFLEFYM